MVTPAGRRLAVVSAVAAAAMVLGSAPALAHVEVEATPARALATDALLTMTAEAESRTAGITGVRIQLPSGLVPADLRLESGPAGWRLSGSGGVVTVAGPALPVRRSLRLGIRVRQLPAAPQLVLKTVQSYSDGRQDSWIELPSVPDPDQPAPVVRLRAAAPGATAVPRTAAAAPPRTTAAPTPSSAAAETGTPRTSGAAPAAGAADDDSGSGAGWLFGGVLVGIALLGGIVVAARRRLR